MTAIAAILVFCLLILSHEFGHFIAAKACGVYVEDFSLGMGPRLLKWQGKETQYTLRLLPIGGWCKMVGEDEDSENPRAFCNKKVWQRILIVAAGPLMNFLTAILLFVIVFSTYNSPENLVGRVTADSPAAVAGLEYGDRIVEINGEEIADWEDIGEAVNQGEAGQALTLTLERDGERLTTILTPVYDAELDRWLIGIQAYQARENIFVAVRNGFLQSFYLLQALVSAIVGMIAGSVAPDVSGPVGIVNMIGVYTEAGWKSLVSFTGFLALNLGLVNLLPLPALDGSRIVFLCIEGVRGKPIKREREGMVHFVGLLLLLGLMLVVTYQDIVRLVTS